MDLRNNQPQKRIMGLGATPSNNSTSRRSFLRRGMAVGGAGVIGAGLLNAGMLAPGIAFAREAEHAEPTKGDIAILRFLAALEIVETDLWQQYNELGGIQLPNDTDGDEGDTTDQTGSGNTPYTAALVNLDGDMPQYIHDNTDDEFTHFTFINAFLKAQHAEQVNLDQFRTLKGSQATGADKNKKRLTNLMQLTVDTSWWTRYRDSEKNPDLGDTFDQAIPTLATGQHPAIPRSDADTTDPTQIQSIANTAAFHFGFIEQGGTSLYPSLALHVTDPVVERILLSIGPSETMHFQVWHDKAGNAVAPPNNVTFGAVSFPNLSTTDEEANNNEKLQANLIMPEPTFSFLGRGFPRVSIIRPTSMTANDAVTALTNDGLFIDPKTGENSALVNFLRELAAAADEAKRQ